MTHTTDLDLAEELIVGRLQRYAARTARMPAQAGLLKADKVISMIRERFEFVRSGRPLQRERGWGERDAVMDRGKPDIPLPNTIVGMTPEERREQRISFVYGMLPFNSTQTREDVRRILEEQGHV